MQAYQKQFIEFALKHKVLKFGEFTLKSGRISPYFFNAGLFQSGSALAQLGRFYAQALAHSGLDFSMLFGPAYKGIPLVASTSIALAEQHNQDYPYCFNRKEAKDHGEGGQLVGAPLQGQVVLVDDVITAGTAIRGAFELIQRSGAKLAGVVVALDRQERGKGQLSAIQELESEYQIPIISLISLNHLIEHLETQQDAQLLGRIRDYQERYGIHSGAIN